MRGETILVAMDIGHEKLFGTKDIQLLVDILRNRSFPAKQAGAQ